MTAETLPVDRQLDFGFQVAGDRGQTPLAEVRIGYPGTRVLGEIMAIQHIGDRSKPYFSGSMSGAIIDMEWQGISERNDDYADGVMRIHSAMRDARRLQYYADWGEAVYERALYSDVPDCFQEVADANTQAVLQDVLRLYAVDYPDYVSNCEEIIEKEVLAAFPEDTHDGPPVFAGVTTGDLFTLMLEGKLTLCGHEIKPKTPKVE